MVADLELQRCRKRIDNAVKEIQDTGAVVHITEDHGEYVYAQVAYGDDEGDWLKAHTVLTMLIDGRHAA